MQKKFLLIPLFFVGSISASFAQISPLVNLNKNYQSGLELLQNEKYVAAAQQFKLVENIRTRVSSQKESNAELSLIKENSKFIDEITAYAKEH